MSFSFKKLKRQVPHFVTALFVTVSMATVLPGQANASTPVYYPPTLVVNTEGPCLGLPSFSIGPPVVVTNCNNTFTSQKWGRYTDTGYSFSFDNHSLCMDVGPGPAYRVVMSPCHYNDSYTSEIWYEQNRSEIGTQYRNGATGLCLDFAHNNGPVGLAACHSAYLSQKWDAE
jgi:hypothetical protein